MTYDFHKLIRTSETIISNQVQITTSNGALITILSILRLKRFVYRFFFGFYIKSSVANLFKRGTICNKMPLTYSPVFGFDFLFLRLLSKTKARPFFSCSLKKCKIQYDYACPSQELSSSFALLSKFLHYLPVLEHCISSSMILNYSVCNSWFPAYRFWTCRNIKYVLGHEKFQSLPIVGEISYTYKCSQKLK